jgi:hypothetical protein
VANGFWAASLEEERPIQDAWADQLVEIRDVTDRVYAALAGVSGAERRAQRREEAKEAIVDEITRELGGEDAGYNVEMVELYAGGRYSVYIFKRYKDVRLVMSPELQVAYFGGDWDNFTYPRYDLDVTFYRVYGEDGSPSAHRALLSLQAGGGRGGGPGLRHRESRIHLQAPDRGRVGIPT